LEAVIEQKTTLGGPHHHAFYIQQYVEKPGRDIRIHVIGGKVIAAIYRKSSHWITNTARGAEALPCPIDKNLESIAKKAGDAIGEGVLGIDIFETKKGYVVNEVNHTIEFKNVQRVTGVNIAGYILDYCIKIANKK
ncbi:RimK family alpha-L-glutamate ligase, partial [Candidatus Gottesmanbacteria bacterium]|nr:RimK family alpha-L-glutamate ligase [Candidatus Gottesmanbacteria bacterium]